ncbi:hypothetical protein NQ317_017317 [Molorchus minor]|uniref:YqaJ viral recombinase domain-containing protein n=1 Tax=Molorchus minor TaxID=1323400 RepID=A0ABQ9K0H5_9CUCU|nr:hypothetical protein NQ317_017317 [Molorchus minor]
MKTSPEFELKFRKSKGEPFEVWRWIGSANLSMSGDHSEYKYRQGRRIVDVQYLIAEVLNFPHKWLRFCSNSDIEIKNEVREGVSSILLLRCKCCNREHPVCSEDPGLELMNINLALVAGIASLGLNMYHLNEICSSLHIPGITKEEYNQYLDELMESYNLSLTDAEKSMKKSYESVKNSFQEQSIRTSTPKKNENVSDYEIKKIAFLKDLEKSAEEIEIIARLTVNQRAEPLWFEERRKRLTASNFGKVFKLLDKTDRKNLVNQITNSTFVGNMYTKYGNENEKNAIKDFENLLGVCVVNCGLFIHQDYPFLAASPDGLIEENAIIEVKCPYKAKELTPEEAINKNLIQYATIENGAFTLKRSDHYYYQVQGQLFVTGRQFCYFVVWTPLGLVYEKIVRDEACWSKMFPKLENFYFQHMLPVLLEET